MASAIALYLLHYHRPYGDGCVSLTPTLVRMVTDEITETNRPRRSDPNIFGPISLSVYMVNKVKY